ncbi:MAG: DUF815 domain-containing protein [Cardiobacteriaceae bacterium]|nr:DUF815 domain-containing protein [Cardiobacteriaceae bacterium]
MNDNHDFFRLTSLLREHDALSRMRYGGEAMLVPVTVREDVRLSDLLALERQITAATANVEAFLRGDAYNHMQFWGARGTGKSSLVRALFHHYRNQGLAIVQLASDDLHDLAYLLWTMGQVSRHFVVFIDDLSFSADDGGYRALKAVLDGSLTGIAANVMLVVTSNRRHFLPEHHADDRALHPEEDVEEHISLSERFGLRLSFHPLKQDEYLAAVAHWLEVDVLDEATRRAALQFALAAGSRSARVASQFVRSRGREA